MAWSGSILAQLAYSMRRGADTRGAGTKRYVSRLALSCPLSLNKFRAARPRARMSAVSPPNVPLLPRSRRTPSMLHAPRRTWNCWIVRERRPQRWGGAATGRQGFTQCTARTETRAALARIPNACGTRTTITHTTHFHFDRASTPCPRQRPCIRSSKCCTKTDELLGSAVAWKHYSAHRRVAQSPFFFKCQRLCDVPAAGRMSASPSLSSDGQRLSDLMRMHRAAHCGANHMQRRACSAWPMTKKLFTNRGQENRSAATNRSEESK